MEEEEEEEEEGGGGEEEEGSWRDVKTKYIDTQQGCKRYIKQTWNPFR